MTGLVYAVIPVGFLVLTLFSHLSSVDFKHFEILRAIGKGAFGKVKLKPFTL